MVSQLEAKGYIGTVFCIDGAPLVMHEFANILGNTDDEVRTNCLLRMLMLYDVPPKELGDLAVSNPT